MGEFQRYQWRRRTVEECYALSLDTIERFLDNPLPLALTWSVSGTPTERANLRWSQSGVEVTYSLQRTQSGVSAATDRVAIERTHRGGYRAYFRCPRCNRRARNVYRYSGVRFACRTCHGLTYQTHQRHRSAVQRFASWTSQPRRSPRYPPATLTQFVRRDDISAMLPGPRYAFMHRRYSKGQSWEGLWGKPGRPSKRKIRERLREERRREQERGRRHLYTSVALPPLSPLFLPPLAAPRSSTPTRPPGRPKTKRPYHWRTPRAKQSPRYGEAYCVRCKRAVRLLYPKAICLDRRRFGRLRRQFALRGQCSTCRTRLHRFVSFETWLHWRMKQPFTLGVR